MRVHIRSVSLTAGLIVAVLLLPGISSATTLYRYTYHGGPEYELMTQDLPQGVGQMTGYFDFLAPLEAGWHPYLSPISYSFTDGLTSINENSGYELNYFEAHISESGEIDYHGFHFSVPIAELTDPFHHISFLANTYGEQTEYCSADCTPQNWMYADAIALTTDFAGAGITAPYWTTTVIPIPAAIWLFGSCLGWLGWLRRRQAA